MLQATLWSLLLLPLTELRKRNCTEIAESSGEYQRSFLSLVQIIGRWSPFLFLSLFCITVVCGSPKIRHCICEITTEAPDCYEEGYSMYSNGLPWSCIIFAKPIKSLLKRCPHPVVVFCPTFCYMGDRHLIVVLERSFPKLILPGNPWLPLPF